MDTVVVGGCQYLTSVFGIFVGIFSSVRYLVSVF